MTPQAIARQLRDLGVTEGAVLLVHTSFRAIRPVEGGPLGLIEALRLALGPRGTLAMPSWSGDEDNPFDPAMTASDADLGVTADVFWRQPGVLRSSHLHAFAAAGPHAAEIVSDPLPLPPHRYESPVGRIFDLDGYVLLLGVGHDADTTLHLAECLARVPYGVERHCTVTDQDGRPNRVAYRENDHCCARFALAGDWLRERGLQREGPVGRAHARLARSRDIVAVAQEHLRRDPLIFLHPREARCEECNEARASAVG
ncbi:MAG TPA: AAC(3)-VI family aminoglycoside N-acetyltransferase [Solibacterales bacterium]|nr:AAC(3)-VI family aminoglycoside N-acetyltransferase [Bryobacterales bacterium]